MKLRFRRQINTLRINRGNMPTPSHPVEVRGQHFDLAWEALKVSDQGFFLLKQCFGSTQIDAQIFGRQTVRVARGAAVEVNGLNIEFEHTAVCQIEIFRRAEKFTSVTISGPFKRDAIKPVCSPDQRHTPVPQHVAPLTLAQSDRHSRVGHNVTGMMAYRGSVKDNTPIGFNREIRDSAIGKALVAIQGRQ